MALWIDFKYEPVPGRSYQSFLADSEGYLVETRRADESCLLSLQRRPLRDRQGKPLLEGLSWKVEGSVAIYGRGVWRVASINSTEDRARITKIEGEDLIRFLHQDGYPELAESRTVILDDAITVDMRRVEMLLRDEDYVVRPACNRIETNAPMQAIAKIVEKVRLGEG